MPIGWIDFSKDERNKVLNVIHILEEPEAIDELGIGIIRDAFADEFFPGTSTVQTRAKYFLIVPYILLEAGNGSYGSDLNTILQRIDYEERNCRDILIKTDSSGVIGSLVPHSWVLRAPSNIYWNGIKKLHIFRENLSIKEYIHQSIIQRNLKKVKAYGNRDKDAEENEKDDFDAGDITTVQFWELGDLYQTDWRDNLTIDLLPEEAAFLKSQIIRSQRDKLFAFILKNDISLDEYDSFGALSEDIKDLVAPDLRHLLELANEFNDLVSIITTRYNLIIFDGQNTLAQRKWDILSKDLDQRSKVNLNAIYALLKINNTKLKSFLLMVQDAIRNGDIESVDKLIISRERYLKGENRAKTSRIGEYSEQSVRWIGIDIFDYRYTQAKRIIRDIFNAEVK